MTVDDIIPERAQLALAQTDKRLARLAALDADRKTEALTWLAGYSPLVFDATLDATEPCTADDAPDPSADPEPFCKSCGANVGIFLGGGPDWRHFRGEGTLASKAEPYDTDHIPVIAWRPSPATDSTAC